MLSAIQCPRRAILCFTKMKSRQGTILKSLWLMRISLGWALPSRLRQRHSKRKRYLTKAATHSTESSMKRTRYRKIRILTVVVEGEAALGAKLMEPVARRSSAATQVANLSATTSDTITTRVEITVRITSMVVLSPFIEADLVRCA